MFDAAQSLFAAHLKSEWPGAAHGSEERLVVGVIVKALYQNGPSDVFQSGFDGDCRLQIAERLLSNADRGGVEVDDDGATDDIKVVHRFQ